MKKILNFLIILILCSSFVYSSEPTIATLRAVYSNSSQKFNIKQYEFLCKAYGVISVEDLYLESKVNSECKKSIDKFYKQNPNIKYFSANMLKLRNNYHIEFKNNKCILYAKGLNTLSEMLLLNGLAIKKSIFKDKEFDYSFTKAQLSSKVNKIGIYKNKINIKCIRELEAVDKRIP